MTASSSARAMRAPGSGGAVIVTVVSPVVALRSGRHTRHLRPAARRDANHLHLHGPDAEQVAAVIRLQKGAAWPRKKIRKRAYRASARSKTPCRCVQIAPEVKLTDAATRRRLLRQPG